MAELLKIILNQITMFATLLTVGFLAVKVGFLTNENVDSLSKIILKIIMPLLMMTIIANGATRQELFTMGSFLVSNIGMFFVLLGIGWLSAILLRLKQPTRNIHIVSSSFVNSALFGYPLIMALFPERAPVAISIFAISETCVAWTLGPILCSPSRGGKYIDLKRVLSPVTVGILVGLIMLLLDIKPDNVIWDTLTGLGNTNKYLGLLFIGADIARRNFRKLFGRSKVFTIILTKLIIGPLTFYFILKFLDIIDHTNIMILTTFAMLPSMLAMTLLAQESKSDADYSSAALLITTVLSLFTMPFVLWIIGKIG